MNYLFYIFAILLLFSGCSKEAQPQQENLQSGIIFKELPQTYLSKSDFSSLPNWEEENYFYAISSFIDSCAAQKTQKIYKDLCAEANTTKDPKAFFQEHFEPYKINTAEGQDEGLLTGYFEPHLKGSRTKTSRYKYPVYNPPKDLIVVDLSEIYPQLKDFRLRGRLDGNKLVPYYTREEVETQSIDADVICYVDSKIDLFFLEIQGSGRITLDDGKSIFVGYANQNGHRYRAIGRYLVDIGALEKEKVSLQSIRAWLAENPQRVDEVLNYNNSVVYFEERSRAASGSLGLRLTPKRSIAIDRRFIPLGSMLYLNTQSDVKEWSGVVQAQDTGGAIKGAIRADMFLGFGDEAMDVAGRLKAPLELWILLPKDES